MAAQKEYNNTKARKQTKEEVQEVETALEHTHTLFTLSFALSVKAPHTHTHRSKMQKYIYVSYIGMGV